MSGSGGQKDLSGTITTPADMSGVQHSDNGGRGAPTKQTFY